MLSLAIVVLLCGKSLHAQIGVSFAPYFFSTAYMSQLYDKTNGFGNNAFGFSACINQGNRFYLEYSRFRIMSEKKRTFEEAYGDGVSGGFNHRNFQWNEIHFDYALLTKKWKDMDKVAPAFAIRTGFIGNTRMTFVSPQMGRDTVYTDTPPFIADSVVYLNRFDFTGVKQRMLSVGFSFKMMRTKKISMNSGFVYLKNLSTGAIHAESVGVNGSDYFRVRQWDVYGDLLYAFYSRYDDYQAWGDYKNSTKTIKGTDIPDLENIGWRVGVKHVAFNPLGLQWVIEYQRLPGQKNNEAADANMDEPGRKNTFLLIGLNFSFGLNFDTN